MGPEQEAFLGLSREQKRQYNKWRKTKDGMIVDRAFGDLAGMLDINNTDGESIPVYKEGIIYEVCKRPENVTKTHMVVRKAIEKAADSMEGCLKEIGKLRCTIDHLGTVYGSMEEMCSVYGIKSSTYSARIKRGMSVEEALTTPVRKRVLSRRGKDMVKTGA